MRDEARDYYADLGLHVQKMIDRRPNSIKPVEIEAGAEELYRQITEEDRQIEPIDIYHTVKDIAKNMQIGEDEYIQRKATGEHYKKVCEENDRLKKNNFWLIIAAMVLLAAVLTFGTTLLAVYMGDLTL